MFIGRSPLVSNTCGMKSEATFINALQRSYSMVKLIQISQDLKSLTMFRTCCATWSLTNGTMKLDTNTRTLLNTAWRHMRRNAEWPMNRQGCPPEACLLALQCTWNTMNCTAEKSLGNSPPPGYRKGTPLISASCCSSSSRTFDASLVWTMMNTMSDQIGSKGGGFVHRRMVKFAWNIGHALTFKVLTNEM